MKKQMAMAIAMVLGLYVASYLALFSSGSYRVGGWGLSGPKGPRVWMPDAFYDRYDEIRGSVFYFYAPLYVLDRHMWHKDTWTPPPPPPFVQGDLTIVPPVRFHRPITREKEGATTPMSMRFSDATGRRFTMRLSLSTSGRIPRSPIYIVPDGDDANPIEVVNQSAFFARIFEAMEEGPEQER